MALSEEQIVRFSRQILLKEVGGAGQERLLAARMRLPGSGAALAVAADYLAAAGVRVEPPERPVQDDEVGFGRTRADVGRSWADAGAAGARAAFMADADGARGPTGCDDLAADRAGRATPRPESSLGEAMNPATRPAAASGSGARGEDLRAQREAGDARAGAAGLASARREVTPPEPRAQRGNRIAPAHAGRGCLAQLPAQPELDGWAVVIGSRDGAAAIAFADASACRDCLARTLAGWGTPPGHLAALVGAAAAQLGVRLILGLEVGIGAREFLPEGTLAAAPVRQCDACGSGG